MSRRVSEFGFLPDSTYRLQFNAGFKISDAEKLIDYFRVLGISHIYSSPLLKARRKSMHGYDVVSHTELNHEICTRSELERFSEKLHASKMGIILDLVPNHMATDNENLIWQCVLMDGRESAYREFFDIDWGKKIRGQKNKIALPILPEALSLVIASKELQLNFRLRDSCTFYLKFGQSKLPISRAGSLYLMDLVKAKLGRKANASLAGKKGSDGSSSPLLNIREKHDLSKIRKIVSEINQNEPKLQELLGTQNYLLIPWRDESNELNYRRFFNINSLIAIKMEDESVFSEAHSLIFDLLNMGIVQGLRIDHPDGLWNPAGYFSRLRKSQTKLPLYSSENGSLLAERQIYVIAEKILDSDEEIPSEWDIDGTTGYDFANEVNGIFVKTDNGKKFDRIYENFTGETKSYKDIAFESKMLFLEQYMRPDTNRLVRLALEKYSDSSNSATVESLDDAIKTCVACFPVYRSYVNDADPISKRDRAYLNHCINEAKRRNKKLDVGCLDLMKELLLGEKPEPGSRFDPTFVMRFQQLCSAVQAKGIEDTAFYRYVRLVSLNEVGGDPSKFGIRLNEFHRKNRRRVTDFPHSMLGTSTHDTKRSEDVRARINVISEFPSEWSKHIAKWHDINANLRQSNYPSANDEYVLYQTILGAWPINESKFPSKEFVERIVGYMLKASREAKLDTNWSYPNTEYEEALERFARKVLNRENSQFLSDFASFRNKIDLLGRYNSISQLVLKLTCPGVPDIYQGNEIWDYSVVDPDNRRQVDYDKRKKTMQRMHDRMNEQQSLVRTAKEILKHSDDGMIKMFIIYRILNFRLKNRDLFNIGWYIPLYAVGQRMDNICSFMRALNDQKIIVAVSRFFSELTEIDSGRRFTFSARKFAGTSLSVPERFASKKYLNLLTNETVTSERAGRVSRLLLKKVFQTLPVAVLLPGS